ncbi:STAS domain-containing protein [Microbispora sp. NPDC049125]|uniref:STAS domain-containing protein n=1 Tax=Microbispora sp. NPDC049125 TaxID=3154929 RepID=UPI003466D581
MPDHQLTVMVHPHPAGPSLIAVAGELDYHTASRLRETLDDLPMTSVPALIIDLTDVSYCDSTGITVLVGAHRGTQAAGIPLALSGVDDNLRRILGIIGLESLFRIYDTADSAAAALTG